MAKFEYDRPLLSTDACTATPASIKIRRPVSKITMWRVIIQCSADGWRNNAVAFKEIAARYPATPLASKKMKDDERRIMEYQLEDISDAESFLEECLKLEGFVGTFEAL